jgi:hypothetical protein
MPRHALLHALALALVVGCEPPPVVATVHLDAPISTGEAAVTLAPGDRFYFDLDVRSLDHPEGVDLMAEAQLVADDAVIGTVRCSLRRFRGAGGGSFSGGSGDCRFQATASSDHLRVRTWIEPASVNVTAVDIDLRIAVAH